MSFELQSLSQPEFQALSRENTVFFICLGPMEDHGGHLPIGADIYEATTFAKIVAHEIEKELPGWQVGFLPPLSMGVESNTSLFSITIRAHVLRDYLVDTCQSLVTQGFKKFVCFSGHSGPKQLTTIEEAGKLLRKKNKSWLKRTDLPSLVSAQSVILDAFESSQVPIWMDPVEHAGRRDTSLALMLYPEKVNILWKNLTEIKKEQKLLDRYFRFRKKQTQGYWGNPGFASREEGAKLIQEKIDTLVPKLKAVWQGARADHVFKSWYSVYPTNWSLFRVWALVAVLFLILGAWLSIAFQAMIAGSLV